MKGQESLDPPPSFFTASLSSGRSLKSLTASRNACHAENQARLLANPSRGVAEAFAVPGRRLHKPNRKASSATALPSVGSPPWSTQPEVVPQRVVPKWQPKSKLSACLSWGGLGQSPMHRTYD